MITTHGAKEVIYGLIAVSSATAMVVFDPRASHSFISREYGEEHKITMLPMRKPQIVNSLEEKRRQTAYAQKLVLT